MRPELLEALSQAERSEPSVKAAALMRIARVLTKTDRAEAERLLDRGLVLIAELPEKVKSSITPQATCLAACVAPNRAFALHAATGDDSGSGKFLIDMVRHGHVTAAVEYLTQWSEEGEFPYQAASSVMSDARDDDARRGILRSGLRAWRRRGERTWHSVHSLLHLLRYYWRKLPADEARDEIAQVVFAIREQPDGRMSGSFGGHRGRVTFSSQRACMLFELLGPLRQLYPELADVMISENPELARAAAVYPLGHDTPYDRPVEPPSAEEHERWLREWTGFALGMRFFRIDESSAATSTTRSHLRIAPSSATRTRNARTWNRASAGRQPKTSERFCTQSASTTRPAAPAFSIAFRTRRFACSH